MSRGRKSQSSLETLADLLAEVIYRDPEVAHFGLENGLIMTGVILSRLSARSPGR